MKTIKILMILAAFFVVVLFIVSVFLTLYALFKFTLHNLSSALLFWIVYYTLGIIMKRLKKNTR